MKTCAVDGCEQPVDRSRLCATHYSRRNSYRGLTVDRFVALMRRTQCAICGRDDVSLVIDHNHSTGEVRDVLCIGCNNALGTIEKVDWVLKAQAYLEFYGDTPEIHAG